MQVQERVQERVLARVLARMQVQPSMRALVQASMQADSQVHSRPAGCQTATALQLPQRELKKASRREMPQASQDRVH
jgi:hypothetical protein